MTTKQALEIIQDNVAIAEAKHPAWSGPRHGHSVIEEEYEEFKEAVFADKEREAFTEVAQLAAVCVRYMKNHAPSSVRLFH